MPSVIAVAAGLLILRSISDDGNDRSGGLGRETTQSTVTDPSDIALSPTLPGPTSESTRAGATVVVINAGEVPQSAAGMTTELTNLGYATEPGVSDDDEDALETTVVYFAGPGPPEAVANAVAADLGGVSVEAAPSPLPIASGDSPGAASVFVVLGTDLSGKSLPLPVAPAVPAPPSAPPSATTG